MSYLFSIDAKNNLVLHPEVVKICPSFRALEEKEILYVVLYADYSSIYKQHPDNERKRKAMWHAFDEDKADLINTDRIKSAVEDYISLQYNPKIETARVYQQKIDDLLLSLKDETSSLAIRKTDEAIEALQKRIDKMNKEVLEDTIDEGVLKGGRSKSFLEKMMSNKKRYEAVVGKKL